MANLETSMSMPLILLHEMEDIENTYSSCEQKKVQFMDV